MGLDQNGTQCVLYAKKAGVDFTRTVQIGRQDLNLSVPELVGNLRRFGFDADKKGAIKLFTANDGFADPFFHFLGAESVESIDFSDYEGATFVHDMNKPIPAQFKDRYSLVVDSGTLEHVFNFPVAVKNCMQMVEPGGYYIGITPANNFMGHGFYQFSPELFYAMFSAAQGFELVRLIAYEDRPHAPWYRVNSPDSVRARITLRNTRPAYLFALARKLASVEPFQEEPQQCDYISAWNRQPESREARSARIRKFVSTSAMQRARQRVRALFGSGNLIERFDVMGFRSQLFEKIDQTSDCESLLRTPS